jgi:hypothetical protein
MFAIIRELCLVVGSKVFTINVNVKYDIDKMPHVGWKVSNWSHKLIDSTKIIYDVSMCHPEYVLNTLAMQKGDFHAIVRSLYNNENAIWINEDQVYTATCKHIIDRKGICAGIPCVACPASYLPDQDDAHCRINGWADSVVDFNTEDSKLVKSCKKYLATRNK